jgi:hypothetical protein
MPAGKKPARRPYLTVEALEKREVLSGDYSGFTLDSTGNLFHTIGRQPQLIDTGVLDFAVVNNKVYDLHTNGDLDSLNSDGSGKSQIDVNDTAFAALADGSIVALESNGSLFRLPSGGNWYRLDSNDSSFAALADGSIVALESNGDLMRLPYAGN